MARIKDKRKRTFTTVGKTAEYIATRLKLIAVFPDVKERLHYIKAIIKDLDEPVNPVLVEGKYPELES